MSSPYAIHPESYLGHLLEGGYRIDKLVGLGGFAAVYRATLFDGTTLAVKIPLSESEQAMRRFLREIKVMQSLPASAHLVRYIGHGQTAEGRPFLAMEYVRGPTLSHGLRARPKLSVGEACTLIYQVTRALMALHSYGIVHRDVKPSNILLAPDGTVKLFDFGLVLDSVGMLRLFEQEDILSGRDFAEDIEKGAVAGTPEYMAPEQFQDALSKEAGARRTSPQADVFSAGIILYRLITGALPHVLPEGQERPRTGRAVLEYIRGRNAALETLRRPAEIDVCLWEILMRALSGVPESRQFDAGLFGEDLHGYLTDGTGPLGLDAPPTDVTDADPGTRRGPQALSAESLFGDLDLDGDTWDGAFVPWEEV